ncbi:Rxt3-domain-containing protein [Paraphaeosphaeria sporulosa]|uniref:Rxt3-domain-containing protein n=1 Tax=Paraphaeosphaeria sporulosa TaxID=1460663 RepID=A0A177CJD5_9PLEO|nr:Rxt3-domain-containing protein [Paraphaeosphaeria sporulosa]OAG06949.1 Rxt3-domain-containing protein [Paraphaeosphaeria sporulosa]
MDARQTHPSPYAHMHNPNHNPNQSNHHQPPPQAPRGGYPPASQPQPPVHIPFAADPYASARRDPFYPPANTQDARRGSYGALGPDNAPPGERQMGWGNSARPHNAVEASQLHSGPPPPPSMSSSHGTPNQSYPYDASRRRSLGGASPPSRYGGPSHEPPPPPPSFARPHMPPPSSPQQQLQQHNHASQSQRAPYASAFGGNRELPGLGQAHHRPGSSMSISSLIGGGETGAPHQASQSHPSPPTNAPSTSSHSMQPPSPRRGPSSGPRPDLPAFRRHPSPERHPYSNSAPRAPEGHTYSAGSPSRAYNHAQGSPDQGRSTLPHSSQPYKPMVFQAQRPYPSPLSDLHARDQRQAAASVPPRPNSQPSGPGLPEQESRASYDIFGQRRPPNGPPEERRRTLGESHHSRPSASELGLGGASESASDRDRPSTVQPVSQSAFGPPNVSRGAIGPQPPRSLWRHPLPEEPTREPEPRREEPHGIFRGYGGYSAPPQGPSPYGGPGPEDMVRGRSLDHLSHRVVEQYHAPPTSDPTSTDRHKSEQLSRSLSSGGRYMYDQNRPFLAFGPDANRRTGRASPLPQAVQGAQAQPLSVGKDPHVKSEFGRMFSGLGGLGSSTPSRGSPMPQGAHDSLPPGTDINEHLRLQRVSSQNGRKPKRVKDEEVFDEDDNDGRNTPLGMRGNKRNKHSHHHHHHAHAHHSHHHHHKGDEEGLPATNGNSNGPPHHHHHYHGAPHHHHHAPRPFQPSVPSPPPPLKVHNIQPILDEAAQNPRKHLGSQLYATTTELPKPNSSLDDQFGYASRPKELPRFSINPINCTYTIRVPRFYLKPRQRQQIVLQRHLWGARVYRDDSDPIAAAIHSGWIRGEWDETVDVKMLDSRLSQANDPSDAQDTLEQIPAAPIIPPADMDLQIELLILPKLEEFAGTTEYGITSRKSSNHDGLSFTINKIRWVDEGLGGRGQERTAAALKRRLDASAALLSLKSGGDDAFRAVNGMTKLSA